MEHNLKHVIIYALVTIGFWATIASLSIDIEYGIVASFPFGLISSKIISTRWPITTSYRRIRTDSGNRLLEEIKPRLVFHSNFSYDERITTRRILQQAIEKYMDKFWAANAERVQAFQTYTSGLCLMFSFLFAIKIIAQTTPQDALLDITTVVLIAATAPVWWFVSDRIKKTGRSGSDARYGSS